MSGPARRDGGHPPPRALEGRFFTSAEVYRLESERIFSRSWVYIGRVESLREPGRYVLFDQDDTSVIVLGTDDGVKAFHNVCRHRGTRLLDENVGRVGKHVTCPYHAWSYGHDGRLVAAPNMVETGGFDPCAHSLAPVTVREWEGAIFLHLGEDVSPFEETYANLLGRARAWCLGDLRCGHSEVYDVRANWKLIVHNYSECYHCPGVHPYLNQLSPYRDTQNDLSEGTLLGGPMRISRADGSMTMSGDRCAAPIPGVHGEDLSQVYYYYLFPNAFLSLHPDFVVAYRVVRQSPERTRVYCDWLFHQEALAVEGFDPADAVEFWDQVNRQDWRVCELTHRGVSSPAYRPGPYSSLESLLPIIDRQYLDVLGE